MDTPPLCGILSPAPESSRRPCSSDGRGGANRAAWAQKDNMKKNAWLLALASATVLAQAQVVDGDKAKVTGTVDIAYGSRGVDGPVAGIPDVYTVNLNVTDTLVFKGKVTSLPTILSDKLGLETQPGQLTYSLDLGIKNPADPSQQKMVGKLTGGVPIDKTGTYQYDKGTLRVAVDAVGKSAEFSSPFKGVAVGKPPKNNSLLAQAKKEAQKIQRQVKGKVMTITVSDYDQLIFQGLTLGMGPVRSYPETTVNGSMLYDYERGAWYFRDVTMSYNQDGKQVTDKLSGSMKWVESPAQGSTRPGEYQVDIRVNEPEAKGEAAVFAGADDESAFFATDSTLAGLSGSIKYKDTLRGETVTASNTVWDLKGAQLSKLQVVNLSKVLAFIAIKPLNDE